MKSLRYLILAIITSSAVCTCTARDHSEYASPTAPILVAVASPEVPAKMKFAGQTIEFDRADMYERMDRELTSMTYTHGNTLLTIKRANRYFPMMAPILEANDVPKDLLYLACVESYLNPRAVSGAKAAGIWQFMPATAKEYGLEVNDYVDERFNPVKETQAACRLLKAAYRRYGNWESAACSYNGGLGRISKELTAQQADSAFDLYLVDETSRYMFRILAMKLIMEDPRHYGFALDADQLYYPIDTRTVRVSDSIDDWAQWAVDNGSNYATLRELNPWIRAKSLPNKTGKTYDVLLPADNNSLLRSKTKHSVYNPNWIIPDNNK